MELHDDDQPIGRVLTRREILKLLGGTGAALAIGAGMTRLNFVQAQAATITPTATALPSCVVRPALTEGPYFVDNVLNRSDLRAMADGTLKQGATLRLKYTVSDVSAESCNPIEGAQVDVWHCDALGEYSGVTDSGFDNSDEIWLRGYQLTDEYGSAEFTTIVPGWYSGRAVHIHFKIRTDPESDSGYEFTSQLFFDADFTAKVYAEAPYSSKGTQDVMNEEDNIFQGSDGLLTLVVTEDEDGGYTANFGIGLDLSEPSATESSGMTQPGGAPGSNRPGGGAPPDGAPPGGRPPGN